MDRKAEREGRNGGWVAAVVGWLRHFVSFARLIGTLSKHIPMLHESGFFLLTTPTSVQNYRKRILDKVTSRGVTLKSVSKIIVREFWIRLRVGVLP